MISLSGVSLQMLPQSSQPSAKQLANSARCSGLILSSEMRPQLFDSSHIYLLRPFASLIHREHREEGCQSAIAG